ncbi:hypothetical protein [Streptomyces tagetis]|uniref:Gram-positive cocci surface proteins LPxTG domain-containing protein n=1 Tax=Streptomyces tagetis TaxID=2820809 RepID=A0A940XEZ1_9ACTN|nr:hypothetical protein [Streptomyces sp. RG38]MBQ0827056.1 hypothetical protein [Streptomyces sp. RG38]
MRSARTLLATAAAAGVLAFGAPGAHAAAGGDWNNDDSSYSKEHDSGNRHDQPRGGMHTGGGALSAVSADGGWDGGGESGGKSWSGGGDREQPRGGMHTGGGGLAQPGTTAGGLAVLAVAGAGLYALRRRKTSNGTA